MSKYFYFGKSLDGTAEDDDNFFDYNFSDSPDDLNPDSEDDLDLDFEDDELDFEDDLDLEDEDLDNTDNLDDDELELDDDPIHGTSPDDLPDEDQESSLTAEPKRPLFIFPK